MGTVYAAVLYDIIYHVIAMVRADFHMQNAQII